MTANAAGTWYLRVQDNEGNIGSCSITMRSYTVYNMILKSTGTSGTYNTTNYTQKSSGTYIIPNGTSMTLSSIYTTPSATAASSVTFKGYSTSAPSTTAASLSTSAPTISSNATYTMWFNCDYKFLKEVTTGSYVSYTGNNGCSGNYCSGTSVSYCQISSYTFDYSGWRVAYIANGTAYLISGGAPECMSTDSSGNTSTSGVSSYELTLGSPTHLANLDKKALKYCNATYAYGGACNSSSAWNMDATDFNKITGSTLSACYSSSTTSCGTGNTLINNGGYYWYATPYDTTTRVSVYHWTPRYVYINLGTSDSAYGVRPIIRMAADVLVSGGSGTAASPYTITK